MPTVRVESEQPKQWTKEQLEFLRSLALPELIRNEWLGLTPFEQGCGLRWLDGHTETQIYDALFGDDAAALRGRKRREFQYHQQRRVRWALERVGAKVMRVHPEAVTAGYQFNRALLDAVRNRKESKGAVGGGAVGLLPYIDIDSDSITPEMRREILADPEYHCNVSMRSPLLGTGHPALRQSKADCLRHLASGL